MIIIIDSKNTTFQSVVCDTRKTFIVLLESASAYKCASFLPNHHNFEREQERKQLETSRYFMALVHDDDSSPNFDDVEFLN